LWKRYVGDRLPPEKKVTVPAFRPAGRARERLGLFFRQTVLLTIRYAAIWRSDYLSLLAMASQALIVALLLGLLFGDLSAVKDPSDHTLRSVNLMFLLAVSSFWFGCNNAAKEIVKERVIFERERDFNLRVESYYASKLLLLTAFSWFQTVLLFAITCIWCGPPGSFESELLVLLALALTGVTVGLAISALATTEEMAITLIPMVVIPQIILSCAISPVDGFSKLLAFVGVSTYWGKRGLDGCLPEDVARSLLPSGLEQHSISVAVMVLMLHTIIGIAIALTVLHWQNRRRAGSS
jgi:hypothetical protein